MIFKMDSILHHLEPVAQLCEDVPIPCIYQAPCADLQWDVVTLEAVALDGGGQLLVPIRLPLHRCRHVGQSIPGDHQLDELHLLGLPVDDDQVRLLSRHCHIGGDGDAIDSVAVKVSIDFHSFQPLDREE